MKICHLIFLSKNKKSLNSAFLFFLDIITSTFKINNTFSRKKTKKFFITILKSPHVNKKAQEQFESHLYTKQFSILYSNRNLSNFIFIKRIWGNLFSDVKLKIKFLIKKEKKTINFKNYKLNFKENMNYSFSYIKILSKIFNFYGELNIKNKNI